jgi:hypothetical protein
MACTMELLVNDEDLRHMNCEDRLRELLRDPRWSLAPWPDAQSRVRRAARRQRRAVAAAAGAVAVVITVAAASALLAVLPSAPSTVSAGQSPAAAGRTSRPEASRSSPPPASVTPTGLPSTPPVGSAAFPVSIYPAPKSPRVATAALTLCPDPAGLEDPGPYTAAAARTVLHLLGRGLADDLRVSDRSAWPFLASSRNLGGIALLTFTRKSVLFAGPLQAARGVPAGLRGAVASGCGTRVARATWVVSLRLTRRPALDADMLFVTRRGHMLFYAVI